MKERDNVTVLFPDLMKFLPPYYQESKVTQEIQESIGVEIYNVQIVIQDIYKQLFVTTATWGLDIYEEELGIPVNRDKSLEERRGVILAKIKKTKVINEDAIINVAAGFENGEISLSVDDGIVTVYFDDIKGIPSNIDDIEAAIKDVIPSHLLVQFKFLYNAWKDYLTKTWGDLLGETWGSVLTSKNTERIITFGKDSGLGYIVSTGKPSRFQVMAQPEIILKGEDV